MEAILAAEVPTGRPPIPQQIQALIRRMANENPSWGEERIANELLLKLGIRVSPRTVSKYLPRRPTRRPRGDMRWSTFLRLHAQGIIACDFFVAVTATFRLLYVFVVIEHRSRRLIHCNVTAHPSAAWTLQQLREAIGLQDRYEYLLHDRDSIFANHLDESIARLGVKVLKSPPRSPTANAICERVIGTIRRECLDWLIPLSESHLRSILKSWIPHYNTGRPHMALGPGVPDPPATRNHQTSLKITPSLARRGCRARQLRAGWATPRVFLGATDRVAEYLRMTSVLRARGPMVLWRRARHRLAPAASSVKLTRYIRRSRFRRLFFLSIRRRTTCRCES